MDIYLTHCSKEKSMAAKASGLAVPPDELYTDIGIQAFMKACKILGVNWAILSDNYGVFFSDEKHEYYEKPPETVTAEEEAVIIYQFDVKLASFDKIWFYVRTETFHPFYKRVLKRSNLAKKVFKFTNLRYLF